MKKEWKVYIKSVPGRGNEIIEMLENLGAKNLFDYEGNKLEALYYIWHTGSIHMESTNNEYGQIIMDNYKEIKLPEQWKDGDILFSETDNEFAVFKHECKINSNSTDRFFCHLITCNGLCSTYQVILKIDFRLATKLEVEQFHKRLHAIKKDWDAEKKQLVDWKWKPAVGDRCWMVTSNGKVNMFLWFGDKTNMKLLDFGNCFHTKEEAKIAGKKIKHLLKEE